MPRFEGTLRADGSYEPVIEVEFALPDKTSPPITALLDSGADFTLAPFELFEIAGVAWDDLGPDLVSRGAGAQFSTRLIPASVSFRGRIFAQEVHVAEPECIPVVLLGREDFFKHFVVRFNWHQNPPTFNVDPVS